MSSFCIKLNAMSKKKNSFDEMFNITQSESKKPRTDDTTIVTPTCATQFERMLSRPNFANTHITIKTLSDDSLVLYLHDKTTLVIYEKIILESELENCGVPQLSSISFLNNLLKDALEENDTSILTYTIEHQNDSGNECIRFVIKNSYRYGPYQFTLDVPRKRLDENTKITLRLDKVLSENEQLRQSVVDTQAQLQNVITQFQPMVSELKYMRDLENFRHGFTIHITEDILNTLFNMPNTKGHWTQTRSFGGLDVVAFGANVGLTSGNHNLLKSIASHCDTLSPTYRKIAQTALDLYNKQHSQTLKSYHLGHKCNSASIIHHLTREKATRVEITFVVPKDVAFTIRGEPCVKDFHRGSCLHHVKNSAQCDWDKNKNNNRTHTHIVQSMPISFSDQAAQKLTPKQELCTDIFALSHSLNGTTWIIKWNAVDQYWELESAYVEKMKDFYYWSALDLHPEWRAQGVHHTYKVVQCDDDDDDD